jgi:hypothetical protein
LFLTHPSEINSSQLPHRKLLASALSERTIHRRPKRRNPMTLENYENHSCEAPAMYPRGTFV